MPIILASISPRRRELLNSLDWDFIVVPSEIIEKTIQGEKPEEMVLRLAKEKAKDVYKRNLNNWVIGADTVVTIDENIFGKPKDIVEAKKMLNTLQGRTHVVITAVALYSPDGRKLVAAEKTLVTFRKMTLNEIDAYIDQSEYADKAGAYAIQNKGVLLVEKINGCYFKVVGLPLQLLSTMFAKLGWSLSEQWRAK